MGKYVLKRIAVAIPLIIIVSFLVYALMALVPGDVVYSISPDATEEQRAIIREELGLDDPIVIRYFNYMKGVFQGDLGMSLYGDINVWKEYTARLPKTIELAIASMLFCIVFSIPLGILSATHHNSWLDTFASALSIMGQSLPNFWLGLMLMLLFAVRLNWLPSTGADAGLKSIILPAITLGMQNMSLIMRTTRSAMLECIRADYLRTARAKGVTERRVIWYHALKNALIPIMTALGNQFISLIAGAAVVESVFAWPGIGQMLVTAIRTTDYFMATGSILMTTLLITAILMIVDISYAFVDPRIKAQYTR